MGCQQQISIRIDGQGLARIQDGDRGCFLDDCRTGDTMARHGIVHTEVAFLQKPFTIDALSKKLKEVLDRT